MTEETDILDRAHEALCTALTVLPDHAEPGDPTWNWCWDELSGDAQDRVKEARSQILDVLRELERDPND